MDPTYYSALVCTYIIAAMKHLVSRVRCVPVCSLAVRVKHYPGPRQLWTPTSFRQVFRPPLPVYNKVAHQRKISDHTYETSGRREGRVAIRIVILIRSIFFNIINRTNKLAVTNSNGL
jgi:hypothetical protein